MLARSLACGWRRRRRPVTEMATRCFFPRDAVAGRHQSKAAAEALEQLHHGGRVLSREEVGGAVRVKIDHNVTLSILSLQNNNINIPAACQCLVRPNSSTASLESKRTHVSRAAAAVP